MKSFFVLGIPGVAAVALCACPPPPSSNPDPDHSSVSVEPASATADGLATVALHVVIRDASDYPVRGAQVTFLVSGSGNEILQPALTDATGSTGGLVSSTRAETKRVTVSVAASGGSGVLLSQQPLVEFTPGPAARLAFAVPPGNAAPGNVIAPAVEVAVQDANGNLVTADARTVSVALQGGTAGAALSGTTATAATGGLATYADLSVDLAGTGYRLAASAPGLTGAQSAAFDIAAPDVTCSQTIHSVTRSGVIDRPGDLSATAIGAYVPKAGGGYDYHPGAGDVGTCLIRNVPQGRYLFRYGTHYFDTAARIVDLSFSTQGHPDRPIGGVDTSLYATLSNLSPVVAGVTRPRFYATSFDTGDWAAPFVSPNTGASEALLPFFWDGQRLPDATKGDQVSITELVAQNPPEYPSADGGSSIRAYHAAGRFYQGSFTMVDHAETAIDGGMSAVPQDRTAVLTWNVGAFGALTPQINPSALPYGISFYEGPLVDSSRGLYGSMPRILMVNWLWDPSDADYSITATYGDPFPPQYGLVARTYVGWDVYQDLPLGDGGVASIYSYGEIALRDRLSTFPLGSMQPAVGPVVAPLVNGADFFARQAGVGVAPVVSWSPPALGTATHYTVEIAEARPGYTGTDSTLQIGSVDTSLTRLRLPPILVPGRSYVLKIVAHDSPGHDPATRPLETGWPAHYASSVSGLLSP